MKRFTLSVILMVGITSNIWADTVIEGIKYTLNDDFTATVTGLDDKSFTGTLTIPDSIKSYGNTYYITNIGNQAFREYKFKTVSIGNFITSIGDSAFHYCRSLTSVTIGNSVTSIGSNAFNGCSGLTKVIINDLTAWCNISFGNSFGNPLSYADHLYSDENTEITNLVIPDGVTSIKDYVFLNCSGLTSVTIPNSVTSIGQSAFSGCSGLTSVTIPNSVTSIGSSAFFYCSGLTSVTIGNSVTSIGDYAFYGCTGLTSVTIPNSVTSIGNQAFMDCSGLTSVTIPNSVTSIGTSAFSRCTGLTEINVDENNSTYSSIDGVVFNKLQTELVLCPRGKQGAYTIPNSVTSIGQSAFSYCSGLTSVTIPNSVTSIGKSAFSGCSGLTSVTIPNSVTSIGYSAFSGCSGLTSITIPNSVTSIGEHAFSYCSGLTGINVDENNTAYSSIDGVLFNKPQTELIRYPDGKQGAYTIPNSVTSIGYSAFYGCSGLTSITIPNSVTSIGDWAFDECSGLTSITIPNSVTSIGNRAFWGCTGLTSVTIGNSVTSIGNYAFRECSGLTDIYCHIEEPLTIESSVFYNVPTNTCMLHVPIGSKNKYKATYIWKNFLNIVEDLPTGIVSIDNSQSTIDNDIWFMLNGVRLNGKPTIPGIYIVNGKKVVIK